jgi:hypothetical protein
MSHVASVELEVDDIPSLKEAAKAMGLEFVENQKTYKWFGRFMNDYSGANAAHLHGINPKDYGKCEHAIRIPGDSKAYEIGVVKRADGKPGYQLVWDFWAGGYGLRAKIGNDGGLLKQSYAVMRAKKEMLRKGYRATTTKDAKGNMLLTFTE